MALSRNTVDKGSKYYREEERVSKQKLTFSDTTLTFISLAKSSHIMSPMFKTARKVTLVL